MKKLVGILVLGTLIFTSCETEIALDLPDYEPEISVEGQIQNNQPPLIILTKTQGYFDPVDANTFGNTFVRGATVTLSNGDGTNYPLQEICTSDIPDSLKPLISQITGIPRESLDVFNYCVYTSFNPLIWGEAGKTYSLAVLAEGKTLTAQTIIPPLIALDSIWYQRGVGQDSLGFMWASLTDPDTVGNNYRWYAQRINKHTFGVQNGEQKDAFPVAPLGSVFDDKFFNGLSFEFAYQRGEVGNIENQDDEGPEEGYFKDYDTVVVKFTTIDRKTFYYLRTLEDQVSTTGSPFASAGNLPGNVAGGHGMFIGYGVVYDTVPCIP